MDDGAQAAHPVDMNATYAVHVTIPALPPIAAIPSVDEVAAMSGVRDATRSPSTSAASPLGQAVPEEPRAVDGAVIEARPTGPLTNASISRLACLFRHWTWANEAMARFERELAAAWEDDADPLADHPFGAFYHWCALLCGFSEAALEHAFLSDLQSQSLRADLEASLPGLRACRQLLVAIPAAFEEHPRIVDLLHDHETLGRLRRIHAAFGDALREEQRSRALEWLLYEH